MFSALWKQCTADGIPRRSLVVALVVGTLLTVINQGDVLLARGDLSFTKLVLTYVVPYCVATYGAVSFGKSRDAPTAPIERK